MAIRRHTGWRGLPRPYNGRGHAGPAGIYGLILLCCRRGAQQPARRATFTANANLVIVDVTVKDKSGKAIDSLTENDFTVLEDGKPQKSLGLEVQKLAMEPAPPLRRRRSTT